MCVWCGVCLVFVSVERACVRVRVRAGIEEKREKEGKEKKKKKVLKEKRVKKEKKREPKDDPFIPVDQSRVGRPILERRPADHPNISISSKHFRVSS